jgi:putative flavoprotein involved in K+ transport
MAPSSHQAREYQCVVIGSGPSGLGTAAALLGRGVDKVVVLERGPRLASAWATRYDRLHLNTSRWFSYLPGQRFPRQAGRWVSGGDLLRYYDDYANKRGVLIRTGVRAQRLSRDRNGWQVETSEGTYAAPTVVVATGKQNRSWQPDWPGLSGFSGTIVHSSEYRNAEPYRGQSALVVGGGNSGMDIALDLSEAGAVPVRLAIRRPPHIMPRHVFGLPHDLFGVTSRRAPVRIVDANALLLRRLLIGNLDALGLPIPDDGPVDRLEVEGRVPAVDPGAFVDAVRARRIAIAAAVERFDRDQVILADGSALEPEVVVAATGYRPALEGLVGHLGVLGDRGLPVVNGPETHPNAPGLFFVGFVDPRSGHLREQRLQAKAVAKQIARRSYAAGKGHSGSAAISRLVRSTEKRSAIPTE